MRLVVLVVVWFALSPVVALAFGALIRAGRGPELHQSLATGDADSSDPGLQVATHGLDDLAA